MLLPSALALGLFALVAVAGASLTPVSAPVGDLDEIGHCLSLDVPIDEEKLEPLKNAVPSGDLALGEARLRPQGVAFVQRALYYKKRARPAPEVAAPAPAPEASVELGAVAAVATSLSANGGASACAWLLDSGSGMGTGLPSAAWSPLELEAFHRLGLVTTLRSCQEQRHRGDAIRTGAATENAASATSPGTLPGRGHSHSQPHHKVLSAWLAAAWGVLTVALILCCVASVVAVPSKQEGDSFTPQLNLVDEEGAWQRGFWHWLSLGWADGLVGRYGKSATAAVSDAEILKERSDFEYEPHRRFRRAWDEQIQKSGGIEAASLVLAFQRVIGNTGCAFLIAAVVIEVGMSMIGMVVALDLLLGYLQTANEAWQAQPGSQIDFLEPTLMIIFLVFGVPMIYRAASIVVSLLDGHYTNLCTAGLASIVYEKALLLPVGGSGDWLEKADDSKIGLRPNIVQLLNVDIIEAWGDLLKTMAYMAVAPIAALVLFILLIARLRLAGVLGTAYIIPALVVTWFIQMFNMLSWKKYQSHQDVRLGYLAELITSIRTIKTLAWERLWHSRIDEAREEELKATFACAVTSGCTQANLHSIPWFSMVIAFFCISFMGGGIEARHIFVIQRIMMSLLMSLQMIAVGIKKMVSVPNSMRRIKAFLLQQERPRSILREPAMDKHGPAVRLVGSFAFLPGSPTVLHGLDLAIPRGELVAVVGGVGSGKTALLLAIIGELFPCGRRPVVEAPEAVAFCAQSPWIFEGTLRENITLNQVMEHDRYQRALHAALLLPDLEVLAGGDQATIGPCGLRISGSQRSRIALARAAYMEQADLVLLDDPFASIDATMGERIFQDLLLGPLLAGRTRVVVTQPTAPLGSFDRLILLEEGHVAVVGPPGEVMATGAFRRFLHGACTTCEDWAATTASYIAPRAERPLEICSAPSPPPLRAMAGLAAGAAELEGHDRFAWTKVRTWLGAAGYGNLCLFLVLVILHRGISLGESVILAKWADMKMTGLVNDEGYMSMLIVAVTACCLCFILVYWAASRLSISASKTLHSRILQKLLHAPLDQYFDKQPTGRLVNRLSFDLRQVDSAIASCILMLVAFCSNFLITQGYILINSPCVVALGALPVYGTLCFYVYLYRGTATPLLFHSKFALSSMQDLHGVVMNSCVSIRANNMRADFMARHNHFSASIVRCQYLIFHVIKSWLQSRVTLCFCVLIALFAFGGLWNQMPMGTLANIISLSFMAMSDFDSVSLLFSNLINVLNALQRLTRLLDIPQEAASETPNDPRVRVSLCLDRGEIAALEARQGVEAEASLPECMDAGRSWLYFQPEEELQRTSLAVFLKGRFPVLRASRDGRALELLEGRRLRDLAPGSAALQDVEDAYDIVAVNSASKSAQEMAEELCNPPAVIWLDLWQKRYVGGMRVQVDQLCAGYCNEPTVLRCFTLEVPPKARVGLVGRTGSGKTTALLSLLRVLEPRSGRIAIGGLDASTLGLRALRSLVGLAPQEPTVFRGTWRYNVDPFSEFPDGRVWEALQRTQLMPHISGLAKGFNAEVSWEGANISHGQRQLLSLARMVIRQPPVLLLDECTSALDPCTREAVQGALQSDFPMSTVLAVTCRHEELRRLDRVFVVEKGMVVEQGFVEDLLQMKGGIFASVIGADRTSELD